MAWSAPPRRPRKALKDTAAMLPGSTDKQISSSPLTLKKPTGNTEEGFMKISLALVLAAISQKLSVAPGFMLMFHV